MNHIADNNRHIAWMLLGLCIVTLFLFLGETLFNTRGEPREAVVALSMLQDGNWVLPVNNGVDMAYKPPFFHWLAALCSLPMGYVNEFTARMPSAIAATVMVMAGFCLFHVSSQILQQLNRVGQPLQDLC